MAFTQIQSSLKGRQVGLSSGGALVLNKANGYQLLIDETGLAVTTPAGVTSVLGGGGSGTVTATGALTASAIILGNGGVDTKSVAGITSDAVSKITLGVAGGAVGAMVYKNATSGSITVQPATGALGAAVLSYPAVTDTIAAIAATQTLTNKTINGANNTITVLGASQISGVIPIANLATGTPTGSKFLRDDGVLAAPSGVGLTSSGGATTLNQLILGNGVVDTKNVAGLSSDGAAKLIVGVAGSSAGSVKFNNATSGDITIQPPTGALGTVTLTLPGTTGTLAIINPPVTLTTSTALTKAVHGNRTIYANSASALTFTINNDVTSGMGSDDYFYIVPVGGGLHTFAAGTATITQPSGTILGSATNPFSITHALAADTYVCTEEFATYPHFALTDAAPIAVDASKVNFSLTMINSRTLANPTNLVDGAILNFWITQDGTGSRVLSFGTKYAAAGGIATIVLSTAPSAVDFLSMQYNLAKDKLVVTIQKAIA